MSKLPADESVVEPTRVLVVEDDPDTQRLVDYILRREGYAVDLVDDAEAALERSARMGRTHPFEVVVTDLLLPGIDGLELARVLRTIEPDLPMILMTAHSTPESAESARALGIAEYLHKPLMAPALVRAVARATAPAAPKEALA